MTLVDQYLQLKTQLCERMSARMTPEQCHEKRMSSRYISCCGCEGLATNTEEEMANKSGVCASCGRHLQLRKRNPPTCTKCFEKSLDPLAGLPTASVEAEPPVIPDEEECAAPTLEDPELAAEEVEAGTVPPSPRLPLTALLRPRGGLLVELPEDLSRMLSDHGLTADDVTEVLWMLLGGELRRVVRT